MYLIISTQPKQLTNAYNKNIGPSKSHQKWLMFLGFPTNFWTSSCQNISNKHLAYKKHQLILERTHQNHPSSFLQRRPQRSWDQGLVEIKRLGLALVPRLTGYNSSAHHRATEKLGSPKRVGVCCLCRITWSSANSNPWEFSGESTMPRMTKYINR